MMAAEILKKLNQNLPLLKEKYPIEEIGLFGSIVRGDERKDSDIDILVKFSGPVGLFEFIHLENELSELLGRKVDLVLKKALKPLIRDRILRETVYV